MDDTNETIADISAELRHNSRGLMFYFRNEENGSTHAMGVDYIELADRLDAALKRERGDCAKLREALEFCVKGMCGFCMMDAEARGMTTKCVLGCEAFLMAKAALAATEQKGESDGSK